MIDVIVINNKAWNVLGCWGLGFGVWGLGHLLCHYSELTDTGWELTGDRRN